MEGVKVPGYAAWFKAGEIHPLEAETLAEFFDGSSASKTPQVYLEYRVHILDRARASAEGRVTFTEARKGLLGDVNAIWRVYSFLTQWGLINYDGKKRPGPALTESAAGAGGSAAAAAGDAPPARKAMRVHAPELGDEHNRLFRFDPRAPPVGGGTGALAGGLESQFRGAGGAQNGGGAGRGAGEGDAVPGVGDGSPRFRCNLTGKDCTAARYHCTAVPDFDISADVDLETADLPPGVTPADFILIEGEPAADGKAACGSMAAGGTGRPWTDHEELLLLEGVELHKDNWAEVAEHVGSRSQLECVVHFVQLPVDPTLHDRDGHGAVGGPAEPLCVLADAGNPIMAQIAFLAGVVGPKVAAAAAEKALEVLRKTSPALIAGSSLAGPLKGAKPPTKIPLVPAEPAGPASGAADAGVKGPTAGAEHPGSPAAGAEAGTGGAAMDELGARGNVDTEMVEAANGGGGGEAAAADEPPSPASLAAASAAALAVASVKAKLLAEKEERAVRALMSEVISTQMQKVQLKLNSLEHLETAMKQQAEQLEREQQQLFAEQVHTQAVRNGTNAKLPASRFS